MGISVVCIQAVGRAERRLPPHNGLGTKLGISCVLFEMFSFQSVVIRRQLALYIPNLWLIAERRLFCPHNGQGTRLGIWCPFESSHLKVV